MKRLTFTPLARTVIGCSLTFLEKSDSDDSE
jgi:hypothetical protein